MVRVTVATLLIACIASVWALPTPKGTHVFMEVARPIELRHDLVRAGRSPSDAYHEVIFVTQERNLDKLEAAALDVSNPASKNYGKYWTVEQIAALTASKSARSMPGPRGREPTSSATSTSLNASRGSPWAVIDCSNGNAQSSSSIMTPFSAFCAFSSGISSNCKMTG